MAIHTHVTAVLLLVLVLACGLPTCRGRKASRPRIAPKRAPNTEWLNYHDRVPDGCPSWLQEYDAFHRANKGTPGAKYIIFRCPRSTGGGLGDRIKGMHGVFKLALASKRLVLFYWDFPGQLEDLWLPATFDWRLKGSGFSRQNITDKTYSAVPWKTNGNKERIDVPTMKDVEALLASDAKYLQFCLRLNYFERCRGCPPLPKSDMEGKVLGYCIFHTLFKPHPRVLKKHKSLVRQMLRQDDPNVPYVAVHWRQGGMSSEKRIYGRVKGQTTKIELFRAITQCAERLARLKKIDTARTPVILLTDSNTWRGLVAAKEIPHIVSPKVLAKHFQRDKTSLNDGVDILGELAIMAGSACFLSSFSGYSDIAHYWRGPSGCHMSIQECWDGYLEDQKLTEAAIKLAREEAARVVAVLPDQATAPGQSRLVSTALAEASSGNRERLSVAEVVAKHAARLELKKEDGGEDGDALGGM